MTVYLVNSLPKIPYIHRIYRVLANPIYLMKTSLHHHIKDLAQCVRATFFNALLHEHVFKISEIFEAITVNTNWGTWRKCTKSAVGDEQNYILAPPHSY